MKRTALLISLVTVAACSDVPSTRLLGPTAAPAIVDGDVIVTNSNDAGPGSFRDAIAQANSDPAIQTIGFLPRVNTIALQSPVTYTGAQDLTINANHATLDATSTGGSGFVMTTNGADLSILAMTVRSAEQEGIRVDVLNTATGTVRVVLRNVDVVDNDGHGLMVEDQTGGTGSAASVDVAIYESRFLRNGFSVSDRDGVRINEGEGGDLRFTFINSRSDDNGADGIELDERGTGHVIIDVQRSHVTRNGVFDPLDLDDGFDIDEAGDGSILGTVAASSANHNYEEGLDFNENDAGDLRVDLYDVVANFNREEGIDYEEDDDFAGGGDLVATMNCVTTQGNGVDGGDGGLKIREKGEGNLDVSLTDVTATRNALAGIHVRESQSGTAVVSITKAVTNANIGTGTGLLGHGIEILGSTAVTTLVNITSSANDGLGISVENGTVNLTGVKGSGNGLGFAGGGAIFVVVP